MYVGVVLQIGQGKGTEGADVGQLAPVGGQLCHRAQGLVPAVQLLALLRQVVAEQAHLAQALLFFRREEAHPGGVDEQAALDAPPARLLHAPIVAERLAHQAPGGDGDDGLVEVLHLDRVQGDVHHIAVGADLGHLDPVAHVQHVVAGELHAGDERQQCVLVHQQQYRRHGAQARQQQQRRAVDERGDDHDGGEDPQHHLGQLHVALDRAGAGMLGAGIDIQQGIEQARQGHGHEQQGEGQGEIAEEVLGGVGELRHQFKAELNHQRGGGLGQAVEHLVLAQVVEPPERGLAGQQAAGMQDQEAGQAADQQRDEQQHAQPERGMQQWMLVEGPPEVEGVVPDALNVHGCESGLYSGTKGL